jgi:hypothetical protein
LEVSGSDEQRTIVVIFANRADEATPLMNIDPFKVERHRVPAYRREQFDQTALPDARGAK